MRSSPTVWDVTIARMACSVRPVPVTSAASPPGIDDDQETSARLTFLEENFSRIQAPRRTLSRQTTQLGRGERREVPDPPEDFSTRRTGLCSRHPFTTGATAAGTHTTARDRRCRRHQNSKWPCRRRVSNASAVRCVPRDQVDGESARSVHSQHVRPRTASTPSRAMSGVMPSAATGSAHHNPKAAFSPRPTTRIAER